MDDPDSGLSWNNSSSWTNVHNNELENIDPIDRQRQNNINKEQAGSQCYSGVENKNGTQTKSSTDVNIAVLMSESITRGRWDVMLSLSVEDIERCFVTDKTSMWTLLHAAVVSKDINSVEQLWQLAPKCCEKYRNSMAARAGVTRWTPLHLAIRHSKSKAVHFLLEKQVDVHIPFEEPHSYRAGNEASIFAKVTIPPLCLAALHSDIYIFKTIAEHVGPEWTKVTDSMSRNLMYWVIKNFEEPDRQKQLLLYLIENSKGKNKGKHFTISTR